MKRKIPAAASYCASTMTVRSEPENYMLARLDDNDAAVDRDGVGLMLAAAPAMLAALQDGLDALLSARSFILQKYGSLNPDREAAIAALKAAIAAAEPAGRRYRYRGLFGIKRIVWASSPGEALSKLAFPGFACEFARLNKPFAMARLEVWNGSAYVAA